MSHEWTLASKLSSSADLQGTDADSYFIVYLKIFRCTSARPLSINISVVKCHKRNLL